MDFDSTDGKWIGGILAPLVLLSYAASVFANGRARFPGRFGGVLELTGFDAELVVVAAGALALALHGIFYWRQSRLANLEPLVSVAGLSLFIGAIAWLIVRQFANFI